MAGTQFGQYVVTCSTRDCYIFPQYKKTGDTMPVRRLSRYLVLHHTSNQEVLYTAHWARGSWHWHDSRLPKPVWEQDVVVELARMLFGGDVGAAKALVACVLRAGTVPQVPYTPATPRKVPVVAAKQHKKRCVPVLRGGVGS